ncbi:MAG: TIGR02452 family protein [Opitutaceae bacterium]
MNRNKRITLAKETLDIIENGSYSLEDGTVVSVRDELQSCVEATTLYTPDQLDRLLLERPAILAQPRVSIEVVNETTLEGAQRLVLESDYERVAALNFASARNPGGGFLGGSQAQEESLARSSGLYASLLPCDGYYGFHRAQKSCLYTDRMIYSPNCPVFRDDSGALLSEPYRVDFITSPAPNAGAVKQNAPEDADSIPDCFDQRVLKLLALAESKACDALVLGAWGCGVFRNDPVMVAETFARHLGVGGAFANSFRLVVFSTFDPSEEQVIFKAFNAALNTLEGSVR